MVVFMIRQLTLEDMEAFVAHYLRHGAESGQQGDLPYGPYESASPIDADRLRKITTERWKLSREETGWRRVYGAFDGDKIVAHVEVVGAQLHSSLHRVSLGLGVERPYRRRGLAAQLMEEMLAWAREDAIIAWVDLGVFKGNTPAFRLYERLGFFEIGRTEDLFRVDGQSITDISMTLKVG
jgi:ribosomal protein S18 acetylase RimI-like enzyme